MDTQAPRRPTFSFQWRLLDDCDQRCKHCYIFSEDNAKPLDRMDWGQMLRILANIDDFCETFGRQPYLYVTGGDPILHPHFWRLYQWEEGLWSIPDGAREGMVYDGCHCGSGHLTILPTGEVYACRRVAWSLAGNVFEDRLADLWLGPMEEYRQVESFGKCSRCELLAWCRGCPAVARGTSGSFYDADPQCWHEVPDAPASAPVPQVPRCAAADGLAERLRRAVDAAA